PDRVIGGAPGTTDLRPFCGREPPSRCAAGNGREVPTAVIPSRICRSASRGHAFGQGSAVLPSSVLGKESSGKSRLKGGRKNAEIPDQGTLHRRGTEGPAEGQGVGP